MAEEVIGLRIQLNGINTVVDDFGKFEKILKEAREDLADIGIKFGIGSAEYKKLAVEIENADKQFNRIKNGNKAARQELEQYRRGTEALSKAFAGATAALTLFGSENETVTSAQKLAAQGLTIVIAAQTIAQTELAGATIATTIATKAETLATQTSNKALKALFTTISANPVGALVAVIGLAVTAWYAFSSGADDAAEAQREFNKAVNEDAGKNLATFRNLTRTIDDTTLSLTTRKKAIDDLKKQYPGYADDLSDEDILVGKLKGRYNDLEAAILQAARAKAAQSRIEALTSKELDLLDEQAEAIDKVAEAESRLARASAASNRVGKDGVDGLAAASVAYSEAEKRLKRVNGELDNNRKEQLKLVGIIKNNTTSTDKYNVAQAEAAKKAEEEAKAEKEKAEALKRAEEAQRRLAEAYKKKVEQQLKSLELLIQAGEIEGEVDAEILEKAKKSLEAAQKLSDERAEFFKTDREEFSEEVGRLFFDVIPTEDELKNLSDAYAILFFKVREEIQTGNTQLLKDGKKTVLDVNKLIERVIDDFKKIDLTGLTPEQVANALASQELIKQTLEKLTPVQEDLLRQYFAFYSENAERFSRKINIGDAFIIQPATEDEIQTKLKQFIDGYETIIRNSNLTQPGKQAEIQKLIGNLFTLPAKSQEEFKKAITDPTGEIGFNAYKEAIEGIKNELVVFAEQNIKVTKESKFVQEEVAKIVQELFKLRDVYKDLSILDLVEPLNPEQLKELRFTVEQTEEAIKFFVETVGKSPEKLDILFGDIESRYSKYVARFGEDGLNELTRRLAGEFSDIEGLTKKQLEQLLLVVQQFALRAKTTIGEDAAKPFEDLAANIQGAIDKIPKTVDDDVLKRLDKISERIQQFQQILGGLGQVFADSFSLALEEIETDYNNAMNSIVGDTKQANDKRVELEKGYQQQKKELEKKARLTSLSITLAETLASGAQAVVEALKIPPPAGYVLAGINGAIAAAQAIVVGQQISYVSQLRRGGKLAAGGVVFGPSHENGGVSFMNGGVELEGNEAVINRNSTVQYGSLLSSINQAQGGRPILVGNAMDSRLIEVLAKQKQEPIRAYVLESDISKSQQINRKLEQLASF